MSNEPILPDLASAPVDVIDVSLPLADLDAALGPLRRVVAYGVAHGGGGIRCFEANGGRSLDRALKLPLPAAVREDLVDMAGALVGFDAATHDHRRDRLSVLYQAIARIDGVLGLPARSKDVDGHDVAAHVGERLSDESEVLATEEAVRGAYRGTWTEPILVDEAPAPEARSVRGDGSRLGDTNGTGRPLEALGLPTELLQALDLAGIGSVSDLLLTPPEGEEVLRPIYGAGLDIPTGRVAVGGRVKSRWTRLYPDGRRADEALLVGAGPLRVRWRNGAPRWLMERLRPDSRVVLVGELTTDADGLQRLLEPELAHDDGHHAARLAVYGLDGVEDTDVRSILLRVMPEVDDLRDSVSADMLDKWGLVDLPVALRDVHLRTSGAEAGRRRLAFDEALVARLGLLWSRYQGGRDRGLAHTVHHGLASKLCQIAEVNLDDDQQAALEDIKRDLRGSGAMQRLLVGEPGAGKGLVALMLAVTVAQGKTQVLVLWPERAAAEQRFALEEPLLRELGLVARLLDAEPSKAQLDALRRGEVHVVYGTHAALTQSLEFRRLGLVIAEERPPFGSVARAIAAFPAPRPDALLLVPGPVPTLALLAAFGDWDVSPLGGGERTSVTVRAYAATDRASAYARAAEMVAARKQAIVAFPMARGGDLLALGEGPEVVATLQAEAFPGARVVLFHGAMSKEERWRVWDEFRHHRHDVLVSTTYFEHASPAPHVSVALIEQADRVPFHRLHHIKGTLSRGEQPAELLLVVGEGADPHARAHLDRLSSDGSDKSALSLDQLVDGSSGELPRLAWLDPVKDADLLDSAQRLARDVLDEDPGLRRGTFPDIARLLRDRWTDVLPTPCPLPAGGAGGGRRRRRRRRR